jgi:hypothetical protein
MPTQNDAKLGGLPTQLDQQKLAAIDHIGSSLKKVSVNVRPNPEARF